MKVVRTDRDPISLWTPRLSVIYFTSQNTVRFRSEKDSEIGCKNTLVLCYMSYNNMTSAGGEEISRL